MRTTTFVSALVAALTTTTTISALAIVNNSPWGLPPSGLVARQDAAAYEHAKNQLIQICDKTITCPGNTPCRTAEQAVEPIARSFAMYGIDTAPEQALLIANIAFESGDFQYDRPINQALSQGTRNMMTQEFLEPYALHLNVAVGPTINDTLKALNANDTYSFGSAAWLYSQHCSNATKAAVQTGSDAGYSQYVNDCLHTADSGSRKAYWQRALEALHVPQSKTQKS